MHVFVHGNNLEKAIKIFRQKLKRDGIFNELKTRSYAITPGQKKRNKAHRGLKRFEQKQLNRRLK